jgi:hypothetical protein
MCLALGNLTNEGRKSDFELYFIFKLRSSGSEEVSQVSSFLPIVAASTNCTNVGSFFVGHLEQESSSKE